MALPNSPPASHLAMLKNSAFCLKVHLAEAEDTASGGLKRDYVEISLNSLCFIQKVWPNGQGREIGAAELMLKFNGFSPNSRQFPIFVTFLLWKIVSKNIKGEKKLISRIPFPNQVDIC